MSNGYTETVSRIFLSRGSHPGPPTLLFSRQTPVQFCDTDALVVVGAELVHQNVEFVEGESVTGKRTILLGAVLLLSDGPFEDLLLVLFIEGNRDSDIVKIVPDNPDGTLADLYEVGLLLLEPRYHFSLL